MKFEEMNPQPPVTSTRLAGTERESSDGLAALRRALEPHRRTRRAGLRARLSAQFRARHARLSDVRLVAGRRLGTP